MRNREISEIARRFTIHGDIRRITPYGSGHIHDTYLLETENPSGTKYILQRLNQRVFPSVDKMMENVSRVISHLKKRLEMIPGSRPERESLTLIPTLEGDSYLRDADGEAWRIFLFIPGTRTYDRIEAPGLAEEAGRAFGGFQELLSDFPAGILTEVIPGFHDLQRRLTDFFAAADRNPFQRLAAIQEEFDFIQKRSDFISHRNLSGKAPGIPLRVTHNDTKINNLLFDEQGRAVCVIDLDVVMPGYIHYDFGDCLRSLACTAVEDEADLETIGLDPFLSEAFVRGYLKSAGGFLTPDEVDLLEFSVELMTFMLGVRFLTDHLSGDIYFKIRYPEQNLRRARVQMKLLRFLEEKRGMLQSLISQTRNRLGMQV